MVGVFGLGAASLAFVTAFRRENPVPPLQPSPPVQPPPAPPGDGAAVIAAGGPQPALDVELSGASPPPASATSLAAADPGSFPRAVFLERLAAFILDLILVIISAQMLHPFRGRGSGIFLLFLAYQIGFLAWKATTVGGIICQLRVVRVDGTPLRFVDALVRGLSSIFSLAVVGLGFLWVLWDPDRQAWHDKIAGTYVVKVPKHWPL
jgi:uncharacterized RDD family membrane protein YckC